MGDFSFKCPECNNNLSVDESGIGLQVTCPKCSKPIIIPSPAKVEPNIRISDKEQVDPKIDGHIYCRNCGKQVHEKAIACPTCGVPPRLERKFCFNCGVSTQANQVMCTKCGCALPNITTSNEKNKLAAVLLAVFFGGLGFHKFYLGYTGQGMTMLMTSIIGGIITAGFVTLVIVVIGLIEGILYLAKSDDEFNRIYVTNKRFWF